MPALEDTFERHTAANPDLSKRTSEPDRHQGNRHPGDALIRPLAVRRADVEARFNRVAAGPEPTAMD